MNYDAVIRCNSFDYASFSQIPFLLAPKAKKEPYNSTVDYEFGLKAKLRKQETIYKFGFIRESWDNNKYDS